MKEFSSGRFSLPILHVGDMETAPPTCRSGRCAGLLQFITLCIQSTRYSRFLKSSHLPWLLLVPRSDHCPSAGFPCNLPLNLSSIQPNQASHLHPTSSILQGPPEASLTNTSGLAMSPHPEVQQPWEVEGGVRGWRVGVLGGAWFVLVHGSIPQLRLSGSMACPCLHPGLDKAWALSEACRAASWTPSPPGRRQHWCLEQGGTGW